MRYNHPMALKFNELAGLETDLQRLIALLYRGLLPRNDQGGMQ